MLLLAEFIRAIRGLIPNEKCNLLDELLQKLLRREVQLNRQEFLQKIKDIAGDDTPALQQALKQLVEESRADGSTGGGGLSLGFSGEFEGEGPSGGAAPSSSSIVEPPPPIL